MGGSSVLAEFVFFGPPHLVAIALTAAAPIGLSLWVRRAGSEKLGRVIAWTLAAALVADELAGLGWAAARVDRWTFLRESLPLHICDAALFAAVAGLVARSDFSFEVAWFWGLGGTLQGVITPNLPAGFPDFEFFRFFILHVGIVTSALFMALGLGMRARPGAVWRVVVATNIYLVLLAGVNLLLGSNYAFLCRAPAGGSPFFFLPWPWYLLTLEAGGVLILLVLNLPFCLFRRRADRRQVS